MRVKLALNEILVQILDSVESFQQVNLDCAAVLVLPAVVSDRCELVLCKLHLFLWFLGNSWARSGGDF